MLLSTPQCPRKLTPIKAPPPPAKKVATSKEDASNCRQVFGKKYGVFNGVLGKGSYGKVYRARKAEGVEFAVKVERDVPVKHFKQPGRDLGVLTQEMMLLEHLKGSPRVIRMIDRAVTPPEKRQRLSTAEDGNNNQGLAEWSCIVMPLYSTTLLGYLFDRDERWFPASTILKMLIEGLEVMHTRSVANLDIKCDNILVNRDPNEYDVSDLVYTDFGSGRIITSDKGSRYVDGPLCTQPGRAPELFGQEGSAYLASDVFSVACVMYRMLVGHHLFVDGLLDILAFHLPSTTMTNRGKVMEQRRGCFVQQLQTIFVVDEHSTRFGQVWERMLSFHPHQRPSPKEVKEAFERCTVQENVDFCRPTNLPACNFDDSDMKPSFKWDMPLHPLYMKRLMGMTDLEAILRSVKRMYKTWHDDEWVYNSVH